VVTTSRALSSKTPSQLGEGAVTRPSGRPASITLTGRGGIVLIFVPSLLGALIGTQIPLGPAPGVMFAGACAAAALMTKRDDLLTLVVCPPLVFMTVTVIARFVAALGDPNIVQSAVAGVLLALAAGAPWLFAGTLMAFGIGFGRGLPDAFKDLRDRLSAGPPARGRRGRSPRPRPAPDDEFDQDPVRWDV
jgi:hypothetical protein